MKENKFKGFLLTITPLFVVLGIQLIIGTVGGIIFGVYIVAYCMANGIEWDALTAAENFSEYVSTHVPDQYTMYLALVTVISEIVMLICGIIWYKKMKKTETGISTLKPFVVLKGLVLGIGIQFVASLIINLLYVIFPESWTASYDSLIGSMLDTSSPLMIISVVLFAPVAEELFFRGIILNYGRRYFPVWAAILIQAVCFGILHLNPVQSTYATLIGLVFGLVAVEYDSVWPGIIVHIGVNASAEILSLMKVEISMPIMSIVGLVLCSLIVTEHLVVKNRKKL